MDPQPFPRRFLGNIRSITRIICNQGTQNETSKLLTMKASPNTRFTSRDTTAVEVFRLVTGLVTVNGNKFFVHVKILITLRGAGIRDSIIAQFTTGDTSAEEHHACSQGH